MQEAEEQSIARYLAGLRFKISETVQFQTYNTLQDVIKFSLKVEALNKYGGFTTNRIKEGFIKNSTSRGPSSAKTTLKPQVKGEVHKPQQECTSKSRKCFKCHGFGHIASECPNRRVVALVEEYEAKEEVVEEEIEYDHENKDDLTMPNHGTSIVVQRSLKIRAAASEENWLRSNVFHTRCTSKHMVCLVIIDNGSFENCVSLEMVQKLDFKMDPHPKPYKLSWLQEGSDIKVNKRCLVSFTIGKHYQDEVWCDVVPMDVCHFLLGRPWQYDRKVIYDGFKNTYTFRKDGHKIVLSPLKPAIAPASKPAEHDSLLSKSELEKEIRASSYVMTLVSIKETESEKEIPKEVEPILAEFVDVVDSCHNKVIRNQQNLYPKFLLLP